MAQSIKQRLEQLADQLEEDASLKDEIVQDPAKAIRDYAARLPAIDTDVWIYRIVVLALGGTIVISVIGAIVLAYIEADIPELLIALGSGAVGALAGLLSPKPQSDY